jgi:hypothetical protein
MVILESVMVGMEMGMVEMEIGDGKDGDGSDIENGGGGDW